MEVCGCSPASVSPPLALGFGTAVTSVAAAPSAPLPSPTPSLWPRPAPVWEASAAAERLDYTKAMSNPAFFSLSTHYRSPPPPPFPSRSCDPGDCISRLDPVPLCDNTVICPRLMLYGPGALLISTRFRRESQLEEETIPGNERDHTLLCAGNCTQDLVVCRLETNNTMSHCSLKK